MPILFVLFFRLLFPVKLSDEINLILRFVLSVFCSLKERLIFKKSPLSTCLYEYL